MNANCPYCDKSIYIDPENYGEDGSTQQRECEHCKKKFIFVAEMVVVYITTYKADCLNGGEHNYEKEFMYPLIRDGKLIVRCAYC